MHVFSYPRKAMSSLKTMCTTPEGYRPLQRGMPYQTFEVKFKAVDRVILDSVDKDRQYPGSNQECAERNWEGFQASWILLCRQTCIAGVLPFRPSRLISRRAVLDVDDFVKILTGNKDTILVATIVGPDAGNSHSIPDAIGVHCPGAFQQPFHPVTFSVLTAGRQQGHHTKSHHCGYDASKPHSSITQ